MLSIFSIYRPPLSSRSSKPFSVFLDELSSFLSTTATTPHEFLINGDFNIHLDNPTDYYASQFLSLLSSFNLTQHVNFPTHNKNHILDLVITSSDSSLAPSLYDLPITSPFSLHFLLAVHLFLFPLFFLFVAFTPLTSLHF